MCQREFTGASPVLGTILPAKKASLADDLKATGNDFFETKDDGPDSKSDAADFQDDLFSTENDRTASLDYKIPRVRRWHPHRAGWDCLLVHPTGRQLFRCSFSFLGGDVQFARRLSLEALS